MRLPWCLAGLSVLAVAAGAPKPASPEWDADLLGTWQGVEAVAQGQRSDLDTVMVVKEGVLVITIHPGDPAAEWGYAVNLTTTPKHIDLKPTTGIAKGRTLKGVYVIEKDRLTICYVSGRAKDLEKQPRPTGVDKPGPDHVILRFDRKKP